MVLLNRSTVSLVLASALLLPLTSCANSSLGEALQSSLAADPKLKESSPQESPQPSPETPTPQNQATLPEEFPGEIPRYPGAALQEVVPAEAGTGQANAPGTLTKWTSQDASNDVLGFYKKELQTNGWTLEEAPLSDQQGNLVARLRDLRVAIAIQPSSVSTPAPTGSPANGSGTDFTIRYTREGSQTTQVPSPAVTPSLPPKDLEAFLGVEGSSDGTVLVETIPNTYTDLDKAPKELQQPIIELAKLGVLNLSPAGNKAKAIPDTTFSPNKPVSRREYARWLFAAHNRLFADRAAQQIRPAQNLGQPAFRDVPPSDPDFAAIQGLAEAGILPSALSGDLTTVTFRPEAQLSRETMLLWKVPTDTRQPLPTANLDAIKQTWGFQDAAKISPKAQQAILADYQNGDLSNVRRVFGYTTLFQPKRVVTRAEAAASLWYFGYAGDGISAQEVLKGAGNQG